MSAGLMARPTATPRKRRVFFSFHYAADIWRVNQVRQSWRYRHESERESRGFFDASLWERSKREGPESLKSLIREGVKNTSVTCVLAGSETYDRRWVRYEIARTVIKGNGLLTVHIHRLSDRNGRTSRAGPDPLAHMGVYRTDDGRILLAETDNAGHWRAYKDYTRAVTLPERWRAPTSRRVIPLSNYAWLYDYVSDGGARNFPQWVARAAKEVARA